MNKVKILAPVLLFLLTACSNLKQPITFIPGGERAGDLLLETCDFESITGPYTADCGTLIVPENRSDEVAIK